MSRFFIIAVTTGFINLGRAIMVASFQATAPSSGLGSGHGALHIQMGAAAEAGSAAASSGFF